MDVFHPCFKYELSLGSPVVYLRVETGTIGGGVGEPTDLEQDPAGSGGSVGSRLGLETSDVSVETEFLSSVRTRGGRVVGPGPRDHVCPCTCLSGRPRLRSSTPSSDARVSPTGGSPWSSGAGRCRGVDDGHEEPCVRCVCAVYVCTYVCTVRVCV